MNQVLIFLLMVTSCISTPISYGDFQANDRIDLLGLSSEVFPILGTPTKVTKEPGYYPDFKQFGREKAVLEKEHWISKIDSMYNRVQKKAADYLELKPLVDTIQEHEKYGNDGEQHRSVAKAIINGFDTLGKNVNNVVELPFKAKNYIGKTVNAALDAVGSKLVGI